MSYSKGDTICVYSEREDILNLITEFGSKISMQVLKCETEEDLIATPCLFAIVDINNLTNDFFEYVSMLKEDEVSDSEKYISYSFPGSEMSRNNSKYFIINPSIDFKYLGSLVQ